MEPAGSLQRLLRYDLLEAELFFAVKSHTDVVRVNFLVSTYDVVWNFDAQFIFENGQNVLCHGYWFGPFLGLLVQFLKVLRNLLEFVKGFEHDELCHFEEE